MKPVPLEPFIITVVILLGFTAFTGAPYVPSRKRDLEQVFRKLYALSEDDLLVDLGSGDGVVLRMARKFGARAVGYELGPVYWLISKMLACGDKKQIIHLKSYWGATFPSSTTVVFAFSDGRDIKKVYELVQRQAILLNREIAFITHGFEVPGRKPNGIFRAYFLYRVSPLLD